MYMVQQQNEERRQMEQTTRAVRRAELQQQREAVHAHIQHVHHGARAEGEQLRQQRAQLERDRAVELARKECQERHEAALQKEVSESLLQQLVSEIASEIEDIDSRR